MKTWNVRIQLGGWIAKVEVEAETAKEAHQKVIDTYSHGEQALKLARQMAR